MKDTNTLQIKGFPVAINKALKIRSVKAGLTFREFIIQLLTEATK
jgi:hypothetical protein